MATKTAGLFHRPPMLFLKVFLAMALFLNVH